eukprot:Em0007g1121a
MDSDFSDEDFDGYIEENNEGCEAGGETEAMEVEEMEQEIVEDQELEDFGIEETEEDDSPIIPPFHQNTGVTRDMNDLQPLISSLSCSTGFADLHSAGIQQYMPKKPHKWGMKARVLAEAETGYTWNFHLYTGKEEARPAGLPLGTHVVIDLVKDLAGKGHHIYFDNFIQVLNYAKHCLPEDLEAVAQCALTGRKFRTPSKGL